MGFCIRNHRRLLKNSHEEGIGLSYKGSSDNKINFTICDVTIHLITLSNRRKYSKIQWI